MYFYEIELLESPRIFRACTATYTHYQNIAIMPNDRFEVAIIRAGNAVYEHEDDSTESIHPMQTVVIPSNKKVKLYGFNEEMQVHDSIQVTGRFNFTLYNTDTLKDRQSIKDRVNAGKAILLPHMFSLGQKYNMALQLSSKVISFAHFSSPADHIRAIAAWYELMSFLTETTIEAMDSAPQQFSPGALNYTRDAKIYISENYSKPLQVEVIANHLGISSGYLHAVFKEVTGLSVMDYVTRYRVEQACSLISNTPMTLRNIAEAVGIPDPSYMSRVFKKVTGLSVREYKQRKNSDVKFYKKTEKSSES